MKYPVSQMPQFFQRHKTLQKTDLYEDTVWLKKIHFQKPQHVNDFPC